VFDKLLIETLTHQFTGLEVIFVVRSLPALNDVTMQEAKKVGLGSLVELIQNGITGPLPGTILSRCSKKFFQLKNKFSKEIYCFEQASQSFV